jgi:hypothetical protein
MSTTPNEPMQDPDTPGMPDTPDDPTPGPDGFPDWDPDQAPPDAQ